MSRAIPEATDGRDAGFTIIEVLVALAIVAVSVVAIGSLMATNVRGVRSLNNMFRWHRRHVPAMTAGFRRVPNFSPARLRDSWKVTHWTVDVTSLGGNWTVPDA